MPLFGKKKEPPEPASPYPKRIESREYKLFKRGEERPLHWYERLCQFSEKILKVKAGESMREKQEKLISFTMMRITPDSIMSLIVLTIILFAAIGVIGIISGLVPIIAGVVVIAVGGLIGYYFYAYPGSYTKEMRVKASSQVVLAILYMVVSMRISPNLERALKFAAANVSGALAWDLRKLLWDIQMRKYPSAWEALDSYMARWKGENEEFAESLRLIRDSTTQVPERSRQILDQALNVVLEGTKTRMKHYAQELKMPVMIIHMMGIILPVMGTIMAPLAAVFMSDVARPEYFIIGYNIVLPLIIVWFINSTLRKRPVTFSEVGIEKHPSIPPKRKFLMKGKPISALPIGLAIMLVFLIPSLLFFGSNPALLTTGIAGRDVTMFTITMSAFVIMGLAFGMAAYFYLTTYQKLKIQQKIEKTESEFELALFQLGNRIAGGVPTEVAIESSISDMKDLEIADLFQRTLNNIRNLGMTFEGALFDKQYGALKYYPSRLIRNIMSAVTDTARKGVRYASESMLRISSYLKNIRETQEYIRDLLEETTSSMKFQAYFLTPMITGLIVSMAHIIILVLAKLGAYLETVSGGMGNSLGLGNFAMAFGYTESNMSPELFQLIIGIYLIEVIMILAMFLTKIGKGENRTVQWNSTSKMLIIGVVFYIIVALAASTMFGGLIEGALSGLGVL